MHVFAIVDVSIPVMLMLAFQSSVGAASSDSAGMYLTFLFSNWVVDKLGRTVDDQHQVSSLYALWTICKGLNTFQPQAATCIKSGDTPECTWGTGPTQFAAVLNSLYGGSPQAQRASCPTARGVYTLLEAVFIDIGRPDWVVS